jgi:hypothetical protein
MAWGEAEPILANALKQSQDFFDVEADCIVCEPARGYRGRFKQSYSLISQPVYISKYTLVKHLKIATVAAVAVVGAAVAGVPDNRIGVLDNFPLKLPAGSQTICLVPAE